MPINTYIAGPIDANNYLVYDNASRDAVLIDCSDYMPDLILFTEQKRINVKYILLTHGHFDHVLGVNKMKNELNAKVFIHKEDIPFTKNIQAQMDFFGMYEDNYDVIQVDDTINSSKNLYLGEEKIEIFETPGHTMGSVSYKIGNALFSGDTLFRGSVGRTDLLGGNFRDIIHSVKDVLFTLSDDIVVFPGHGDSTTIREEKQFNDIIKY